MTRHNRSMSTFPQDGQAYDEKAMPEEQGRRPNGASSERHPMVHGEHMRGGRSMATALHRFINEKSHP